MGVKKKFNFPLTLTASLTRKLTEKEYEEIGKPKEWGVLPVRPMGATVRLTKDRRILIRNTSEYRNPNFMDQKTLDKRILIHKTGKKTFSITSPNEYYFIKLVRCCQDSRNKKWFKSCPKPY